MSWDYFLKPWNSGTHNWYKNWYRIYLAGLAKERLEAKVAEAKDKELYNQFTNLTDEDAIRQFLRDNDMTIDDAQDLLGRHDHHEHKEGVITVVLDEHVCPTNLEHRLSSYHCRVGIVGLRLRLLDL